jgi:hypothetical protein
MSRRRTTTLGGASRDGLTSLGVRAALRRMSAHQRVLRLLVCAGPLLTLAATMAARGAFQPIALMVIGAFAVGCALSPDSHLGLLLVLLLSLNWLQTVDDETTPWLLLAAAGLLLLHASMAASTVAPPAASWNSALAWRWMRRVAAVMAFTLGAWVISVGLTEAAPGGNAFVLIAGLLLIAGVTWWTTSRSLR